MKKPDKKTIFVLAALPVSAACNLIAAVLPRAGMYCLAAAGLAAAAFAVAAVLARGSAACVKILMALTAVNIAAELVVAATYLSDASGALLRSVAAACLALITILPSGALAGYLSVADVRSIPAVTLVLCLATIIIFAALTVKLLRQGAQGKKRPLSSAAAALLLIFAVAVPVGCFGVNIINGRSLPDVKVTQSKDYDFIYEMAVDGVEYMSYPTGGPVYFTDADPNDYEPIAVAGCSDNGLFAAIYGKRLYRSKSDESKILMFGAGDESAHLFRPIADSEKAWSGIL